MSADLEQLQAKVDDALNRLHHLEEQLNGPAPPWRFLVERVHPWRRQLCIKGRNMTVGQLVSTVEANQLDVQAAAEDLALPAEAIEEALRYYALNRELLQLEADEERRRLKERGHPLEPSHLSR